MELHKRQDSEDRPEEDRRFAATHLQASRQESALSSQVCSMGQEMEWLNQTVTDVTDDDSGLPDRPGQTR